MEVVQAVQKVKELPPELHWFCPRSGIRDHGLFYEEDLKGLAEEDHGLSEDERERRIEETDRRKAEVYDALQIFAFDGNDALLLQQWLQEHLDKQMSQCEICARQYHRGRTELKERLEGNYEEDEVRNFLARFDHLNTTRIKRGLLRARKSLMDAPPNDRSVKSVDLRGLYAMFEMFNCDALLADEAFLVEYFDDAFTLVQERKRLKLTSYTPAMVYFLFQENSMRRWWAMTSWAKFQRRITSTEFQWCVRRPLERAAGRVRLEYLEKDFMPAFWAGVKCVVDRLDADLITHSLRALDCNICMLALDHLQVDSNGFRDLLLTVHRILSTSSSDFWEALRATTVAVWIEQFVNSPALDRLLRSLHSKDDNDLLRDLFQWAPLFVSTLKSLQQPSACKGLVGQLFGRFQSDLYAPAVKVFCYKMGTEILVSCLKDLTTDKISSSNRVAIKDILDVINIHIAQVTSHTTRRSSPAAQLSAELLRRTLTLESYCLISDRDLLYEDRPLHLGTCMIHRDIWSHSAKTISNCSTAQATQILLGAKPLVGLENFLIPHGQSSPTKRHYNEALDTCNRYVSEMLERTSERPPSEVQSIFKDSEGAIAVVGQLNSCSAEVRSATVEVLKTATEQTVRKEALGDALASNFAEILDAYSLSLRRVHYLATFASAPSMLKICKDLLDVLCDSSKGLLRIRTMAGSGINATETFWEAMWLELGTIFRSAEAWANSGYDKSMMTKFCGDVMELAGILFDHFPVFLSAIGSSAEPNDRSRAAGKRLTDQPKTTVAAMIRFLRLRDDFLLAKSTALVCDVLRRLKQFNTAVDEAALSQVEKMLRGEINTVLSSNQKAELHSALEHHLGRPVILREDAPASDAASKRPSKAGVIDIEKWKAKAGTDDRPMDVESVMKSSSKSADAFKERQAAKAAAAEKLPFFGKPRSQPVERSSVDADKIARERQEATAAKKRRDAEAIARARGRLNPDGVDGLTAQQGSGIAGMGLSGKDHSIPKGTGMMVSSDESEDDESEDELDRQLFGGKKLGKNPEEVRRLNEAKARRREPQGPVKKQRLVRSAKDNRARLAPDLAPLHKTLLSWDFNHDGAIPPKASMRDYASVLSTFRDPVDYQNTFRPLLTLEAWNGFLKAKDENNAKAFEIKIVNRSTVDAFNEISASIEHKDAKEIGEGDIILLSKSPNISSRGAENGHCLARVGRVSRKKTRIEFLGKVMPGTPMAPHLSPNAKVFGLKIMSIVPLEREYGALLGLQFYDLCDEITKARPSPLLSCSDQRLRPLMDKYTVNKAQAKAIQSALDNDAFTLIQGPPGSGKTKTIVGIVGALLTDVLKHGNANPQPRSEFIANRPPSKKLLVCAPSNAAVDELVMRFKEGVTITSGEHKRVGVVRLGRSDAINSNVFDVTLDEMVNKRLNVVPAGTAREDTQKLMLEHQAVSKALREAIEKADKDDNVANRVERDELRRKKAVLSQKVDTAKDNEGMQNRQADLNRRRAQQDIIEESNIICATLSGSGHDMFQNLNVEFETVVIDEAAQCVELSALIPLKYGCAKCILVGDPQQLPPTVFSKEAANFKYEQSLFVRMQSNHPQAVHLLDTQYRMHPDISAFPSKAFYDGKLLDGKDMASLRGRAWHAADLLGPFQFFDVQGQHQAAPRGHSLVNYAEVRVAMQLYTRLTKDFKQSFRGKVGIITPYKSQLRELKQQFQQQFGNQIVEDIEFNTTDAFQGRESEIIIFSCVRASPSGGIGFLQDIRRMNVGLTRARSSMWVLGNSQSLVKGEYWRKLVEHARMSGHFFNGDIEGVLSKPLKIVRKIEGVPPDKMEIEQEPAKQILPRRPSSSTSSAKTVSSSKIPAAGARFADPMRMQALANKSVPPTIPEKRKLANGNTANKAISVSSSVSSSDSDSSDSDVDMPDAPPARSSGNTKPEVPLTTVPKGQTSRQGPGPITAAASVTKKPIVKKRKKETSIFMKKPAGAK